MAFWSWAKVAGTNASIDPTINFAEGQSPSSVNDSARAVMARLAEYRDDISGLLATGGTSTAFTVATNQVLASVPNDGQILAITPHATNGASPTLRADGGTIYAIQTSPGAAVAAGVLVAGTPYVLKFSLSATAWILHGFFANPFNVPLGVVLDYTGDTAPNSNFALANGQAISRTTYATYFALVGTRFGVGDGTTTFNIPDLSNRVVAGTAMGGTSRITTAGGNFDGTVVGGVGGAQNVTLNTTQIPSHSHTGTTVSAGAHTHTATTSTDGTHSHNGTTGTVSANHFHQFPFGVTTFTGGAIPGITTLGTGASTLNTGNETANHTHAFTTSSDGAHNHTLTTSSDGAHTHGFTTDATGGGAAHSILPPVMTLPKIVRIF